MLQTSPYKSSSSYHKLEKVKKNKVGNNLNYRYYQWRINTHLTGGVQISLGGCIGALPKGHIAITPVL
jgi:hypothetical protein